MLKRAALIASIVTLSMSALQLSQAKGPQTGKEDAGGRAVAHHAGGHVIKSEAVQQRAPDARLYHLGTTSREPTLGTTLNGDVFYAALGFRDVKRADFESSTTKVMRSRDNGGRWEDTSPSIAEVTHRHPVTLDPYVYVDDAEGVDRIFSIDLTVACSYLSFTDDYGETWTTNPLACGRPVNDHQTLFGGPPVSSGTIGYPNLVYYCWNDVGSSSCSKSLDGGITFSVTGQPAFYGYEAANGDPDRRRFCGGLHGHGIVDHRGFVYLPRMYCDSAQLAISKDEGRSWTRVTIDKVGLEGHDPSVAVDDKGNIYYTWLRGRLAGAAGDRLPFLSISKDGGKSWTKPMMIGAPGVKEVNLATMDVSAPGKIAIAYMGSENSPGWPFSGAYNTVTWNGYITMSSNALDNEPTFYSARINQSRDPLKRQKCGPGRCGQTVLDFIDLVIAPDGTPWAAFADACGGECTEPDATEDGEPEGLAGRLVGGPSLR